MFHFPADPSSGLSDARRPSNAGRTRLWAYRSCCFALSLVFAACVIPLPANAAYLTDAPVEGYPENAAPPPPAFDVSRLINVPMPANSSMRLGIDPQTVQLGSDGVVRYVAVMQSTTSAALSVTYEAIRCVSGEYKLYARRYADTGWRPVADPVWVPLSIGGAPRFAVRIAEAGACREASSNTSTAQILKDLRTERNYVAP